MSAASGLATAGTASAPSSPQPPQPSPQPPLQPQPQQPQLSQAYSRKLVSCEKRLLLSLAQPPAHPMTSPLPALPLVSLVSPDSLLHNFQVHVCPGWVVNRSHLSKTFVVHTANPADSIAVAIIAIMKAAATTATATAPAGAPPGTLLPPSGSAAHSVPTSPLDADDGKDASVGGSAVQGAVDALPLTIQRLFGEFHEEGLVPMDTPLGTIMVGQPSEMSVPVPSGDYEASLPLLTLKINLYQMSLLAEDDRIDFEPPTPQTRELAHSRLGISQDVASLEVLMPILVRMLKHTLYFFNTLDREDSDGIICNDTMAGLEHFYFEYGPFDAKFDAVNYPRPWCDPAMFSGLLEKLTEVRDKLTQLGFPPPKNLRSTDPNALRKQIKHFQRSHNLEHTMILDSKTLARMGSSSAVRKVGASILGDAVSSLRSKLEDITGLHGLTGKTASQQSIGDGVEPATTAPAPRRTLVEFVRLILDDKSDASKREIKTTESTPRRRSVIGMMQQQQQQQQGLSPDSKTLQERRRSVSGQQQQQQGQYASSLVVPSASLLPSPQSQPTSGAVLSDRSISPLPGPLTYQGESPVIEASLQVPPVGPLRSKRSMASAASTPPFAPSSDPKQPRGITLSLPPPAMASGMSTSSQQASADISSGISELPRPRTPGNTQQPPQQLRPDPASQSMLSDTLRGLHEGLVKPTSRKLDTIVKKSRSATKKGIEKLSKSISNTNLSGSPTGSTGPGYDVQQQQMLQRAYRDSDRPRPISSSSADMMNSVESNGEDPFDSEFTDGDMEERSIRSTRKTETEQLLMQQQHQIYRHLQHEQQQQQQQQLMYLSDSEYQHQMSGGGAGIGHGNGLGMSMYRPPSMDQLWMLERYRSSRDDRFPYYVVMKPRRAQSVTRLSADVRPVMAGWDAADAGDYDFDRGRGRHEYYRPEQRVFDERVQARERRKRGKRMAKQGARLAKIRGEASTASVATTASTATAATIMTSRLLQQLPQRQEPVADGHANKALRRRASFSGFACTHVFTDGLPDPRAQPPRAGLHPKVVAALHVLDDHYERLKLAVADLDRTSASVTPQITASFEGLHARLAQRLALVRKVEAAVQALVQQQDKWERLVHESETDGQRISYGLGVLFEQFSELDVEMGRFAESVKAAEEKVAQTLMGMLQ
ncbi:hypothetical protein BC831DRAFT_549836 [Entophlyctis helioformis]|nr:hypothetical protein BC831DRAFT_549836 [Entophlyctis helioformis]